MTMKPVVTRYAQILLPPWLFGKLRIFYRQMTGQPVAPPQEAILLKDWSLYLTDDRMDPRLKEMLEVFIDEQEAATASRYWSMLCRKNVAQLLEMGYENFKQTVALNYFTWIIGRDDPQFLFLQGNLSKEAAALARVRAAEPKPHAFMTQEQSEFYNLMTYLLWQYTEETVGAQLMATLEEPSEGNPPSVPLAGRQISQDLANSVLEYDSVSKGLPDVQAIKSIIELGGGYGRTAYAFLRLLPQVRYCLVDIPPALYIAERYLSGQFPSRKIFHYRPFQNFSEVAHEFQEAQIAFLMPDQLPLLPDRVTDLFLAVDCLHEMRPEQIRDYYRTIDRLSDYFYQKCWKKTKIPYDDITLTQDKYPFLPHWRKLFLQDCRVQTSYFETLFHIERS